MSKLSRELMMSISEMRRELEGAVEHIRVAANMLDDKLAQFPELIQFRVDYLKKTELQALEIEDKLLEFDMDCRRMGVDV